MAGAVSGALGWASETGILGSAELLPRFHAFGQIIPHPYPAASEELLRGGGGGGGGTRAAPFWSDFLLNFFAWSLLKKRLNCFKKGNSSKASWRNNHSALSCSKGLESCVLWKSHFSAWRIVRLIDKKGLKTTHHKLGISGKKSKCLLPETMDHSRSPLARWLRLPSLPLLKPQTLSYCSQELDSRSGSLIPSLFKSNNGGGLWTRGIFWKGRNGTGASQRCRRPAALLWGLVPSSRASRLRWWVLGPSALLSSGSPSSILHSALWPNVSKLPVQTQSLKPLSRGRDEVQAPSSVRLYTKSTLPVATEPVILQPTLGDLTSG